MIILFQPAETPCFYLSPIQNEILELQQLYALKWARCLPMWGKVLSQQGQGACPCWAEFMPGGCPIS